MKNKPRKRRIATKRGRAAKSPNQLDLRLTDLPIPIQSFIEKQIDGIANFRKQYPALYDVMFKDIDTKYYRAFESKLEEMQRRKRGG